MGLIYVSGESNSLINGLKENVTSGKATLEQLNSGSQQIISSVDGNTLAGAAYMAAKGLFSELIIPTVSRVTAAIDDLETELQTYKSAHDIVSGEGKLDEDKLNQQIATKKAMKIAVDSSIAVAKSLAKSNPASNVLDSLLSVQSRLGSMSNEYATNIRELEEKLEKLRQFSSSTSGLFSNSLTNMQIAMQSVTVLSNTLVKSDGSYVLPVGTDKSWFTSSKSESDTARFNSVNNLTDKQKMDLAKELDGVPENKRVDTVIAWFEANVFPISQDVALGLLEENGDELSMAFFSESTKNIGTPVSGVFYAGSKVVGNASKAMPFIGAAIDYGSQVMGGESSTDALAKTGAHVVSGIVIGTVVAGLGLTALPTLLIGVAAGFVINSAIDVVYDKGKKLVGNAAKSLKKIWGNLWN